MTADGHVQRELLTKSGPYMERPTYRVTCTCGWQSQWTASWRKSLDNHAIRVQKVPTDG